MSLRFQMLLTTSLFNDVYHVIHFTLKAPRLLTWLKNMKCGRLELRKILINTLIFIFYLSTLFFFFYQGFLLRTPTTHRTAGEGRGSLFIPLYFIAPLIFCERAPFEILLSLRFCLTMQMWSLLQSSSLIPVNWNQILIESTSSTLHGYIKSIF